MDEMDGLGLSGLPVGPEANACMCADHFDHYFYTAAARFLANWQNVHICATS